MISKLLTGGIDLPELRSKVSKLELLLDYKIEETNKALADHIAKANESLSSNTAALAIRCNGLKADVTTLQAVVGSRALAEDVETIRMKLDRLDGEIGNCTFGPRQTGEDGFTPYGLSGVVSDLSIGFHRQAGEIKSLKKQVEALTAAKLSEVKARKAPKK